MYINSIKRSFSNRGAKFIQNTPLTRRRTRIHTQLTTHIYKTGRRFKGVCV